jgi:hypothetical protein
MKKSKATEALRVASEIAVIRAALKKRGYRIHKRPRQAAWKVFNSKVAGTMLNLKCNF